jgi:hypothetical protein
MAQSRRRRNLARTKKNPKRNPKESDDNLFSF